MKPSLHSFLLYGKEVLQPILMLVPWSPASCMTLTRCAEDSGILARERPGSTEPICCVSLRDTPGRSPWGSLPRCKLHTFDSLCTVAVRIQLKPANDLQIAALATLWRLALGVIVGC